jgi:hypothetical protein
MELIFQSFPLYILGFGDISTYRHVSIYRNFRCTEFFPVFPYRVIPVSNTTETPVAVLPNHDLQKSGLG